MSKIIPALAAVLFIGLSACLPPLRAAERVASGLVVRYDFDEGQGDTIYDRSGAGEPLDLKIDLSNTVNWLPGVLSVRSSVLIGSPRPASKIIEALKKSNALSLEAWIKPGNTTQSGPARIVSLSADTSQRNLTLGQDKDFYDLRLRTTGSDNNGNPSTSSPAKSLTGRLTHVVFTRDANGAASMYVDGRPVVSKTVGGDFGKWDAGFRLMLANEVTRDRPWLGDFSLVAIYDRALSAGEVQQNFAAGLAHKPEGGPPDFHKEIAPLLASSCVKCHGPEKQKGGLRLDEKVAALKGGDSGERAIIPGHAAQSRLMELVVSEDPKSRMPPTGDALTAAQTELLKRWIDSGAPWPDSPQPSTKPTRAEMVVTAEDRQHWSFLPLPDVAVPELKNQAGLRTPVDAFIRHKWEEQGVTAAPAADARTLLRRVYFDLIGLPPVLKFEGKILKEERLGIEIDPENFDQNPVALAAVVDRLLDSPQYGERWARHWLDVARFADSDGQEGDADRPNAYHFRDFVIHALNDDLPYDTFVRWQLAGDELAPDNPLAISATGFLVAGNSTKLNVPMEEEKLRNRANELDDMVSTTSQALLGLTLACARCHDHKYDPLPTRDYYRMIRIFNGGDRTDVPLVSPAAQQTHRQAMAAWQTEFDAASKQRDDWLKDARQPVAAQLRAAKIAKLRASDSEKQILRDKPDSAEGKKLAERFKKELRIDDAEYVAALPDDKKSRWGELDRAVTAIAERKPPAIPMAFAFADFSPEPRETWFFERGNFMARNERMELGFLTVLTNGRTAESYWDAAREAKLRNDSTQQRRALAEWITDLDAGGGALLARVMVNRVWQHHFGEGLVRTVNDFGSRGETPTHPELFEWLTREFVRGGWSLKKLHRLIVNSATYRLGSLPNPDGATADPENRLLSHRRPLRLESEILRDSMLAVVGTLNPQMYGPSFKPPIAAEAMQARNVKDPYPRDARDTPETRRRSIYLFHKRVVQYPLMQAFDAPDAQVSCGRRLNTTVAPQALALLNDPFVRQRAGEFAHRLQTEAGNEPLAQVRRAFVLALSREAEKEELTDATTFLTAQASARARREAGQRPEESQRLALTDFCQMLLASNEFLYVD